MSSLLRPVALLFTAFALLFPQTSASAGARELPWKLAATSPHDESAFTQGLLLHKGKLYESTGLYGKSELRTSDPATGKVLRRVPLDARTFGEGLALHKGVLYQLTWREGKVLLYDAATLEPLGWRTFSGEGWGLTGNGTSLIRSDGSSRLYFHDPATFAVVRTVDVADAGASVADLNELEFIHGLILANVWHSDKIAVISPAGGEVLAWIDLAALRPPCCPPGSEKTLNGIAYDAKTGRLLVTGKMWPNLFAIETDLRGLTRQPGEPAPPKDAR